MFLSILQPPTPQSTLNQMTVHPPYMEHGIRFETTELTVTVYFDEILSKVSFSSYNEVLITLDRNHFLNNIEGQCGEHQ